MSNWQMVLGSIFIIAVVVKVVWLLIAHEKGSIESKIVIGLILYEIITLTVKYYGGQGVDDYGLQLMQSHNTDVGEAFSVFFGTIVSIFVSIVAMSILFIGYLIYSSKYRTVKYAETRKVSKEEVISKGPYNFRDEDVTINFIKENKSNMAIKTILHKHDDIYRVIYVDRKDAYNPEFLKLIGGKLYPLREEAKDLLKDGKLIRYNNIPFDSFYLVIDNSRIRLDRYLQNKYNIELKYTVA